MVSLKFVLDLSVLSTAQGHLRMNTHCHKSKHKHSSVSNHAQVRPRSKHSSDKNITFKIRHLCNRVHLHIVFVLLYSVCRSVNVLLCVDVIQSFTYVLRVVILDVTMRAREKARGDTNGPSQIISGKKREEIKQEYLAVARLLLLLPTCYCHRPFTSGAAIRIGSREAKYHQANNRRASNGHSHGGQRKRT